MGELDKLYITESEALNAFKELSGPSAALWIVEHYMRAEGDMINQIGIQLNFLRKDFLALEDEMQVMREQD